ncbi:MAG: hypothetical protein PHR35_00900 [Kiritimatiellae bacterium]|nr:hypothetical protein [Kiritimatiellia bacterium]
MLRERTSAYGTPDLRCLAGVAPFVVVGGLATRLYMPERMTLDTDILVLTEDRDRVEAALCAAGCKRRGSLAIGGSTWTLKNQRPLDLLSMEAPWAHEAVNSPVTGEDGLPYVRLPYLVLMKLASGRLQDLADIGRMLGAAAAPALRAVRRVVARYRPQDADDLESLINLGRLER